MNIILYVFNFIIKNEIYHDISDGAKRNCTTTDFKKRLDAVVEWSQRN
jgi:hypothetical protein